MAEKKKQKTWRERMKEGPSAYRHGIRGHQLLMLDFMMSKGYEVQFERDIFNRPMSSEGILKDPTRMLIGYTKAKVYLTSKLNAWRDNDRKGDKPKPLREATSYCSSSDQFTRRTGNMNVTAKLMREMGLAHEFAAPLRAAKKIARIEARRRKAMRQKLREEQQAAARAKKVVAP